MAFTSAKTASSVLARRDSRLQALHAAASAGIIAAAAKKSTGGRARGSRRGEGSPRSSLVEGWAKFRPVKATSDWQQVYLAAVPHELEVLQPRTKLARRRRRSGAEGPTRRLGDTRGCLAMWTGPSGGDDYDQQQPAALALELASSVVILPALIGAQQKETVRFSISLVIRNNART